VCDWVIATTTHASEPAAAPPAPARAEAAAFAQEAP
jgi:hypothetical protein